MESTEKRREIDFRQQPPVKAAPPKEFKARPKTRSHRTLFALAFFILLTALLYSGMLPAVMPGWIQKGLGVLHACSAALAGFSVMRDLRRRPLPNHHGADAKSPTPPENASVKAAREQKEHLLNSVGHHAPIQPRRKRRWGNMVAAGLFCGVFGLWFTSFAPIAAAETAYDFAAQLNEAASNTTLILTEPSIAVPRPPRPMLQTILAARRISLSRDDYQAALQLITLGKYDEARVKLDVAKKAEGLPPENVLNLELALAQSYLFEGKHTEAIKILKPLWDKQKNTLALAQLAVAALHANLYRESRVWAQQLTDSAKEPVEKLRAMNLILALDLLQWRSDRNRREADARALIKDSVDVHAGSLQNNLGVLKLFAAPPQTTAAQGNFSAALDLWNALDQANLPKNQHDPIVSAAYQNIAYCEWWQGDYGAAFDQIELAQQYRQAVRVEGDQKPLPGDQAVQARGILASCLFENTLGRWQASRNKAKESMIFYRALPRTDPHRMASNLLEARVSINFVRYDDAISRCNEVLKDASLYTPQHPLVISAKLHLAEALIGKKRFAEARPILGEVLAHLTSLRWHEDHPEVLTYYRILAQLETGEKNFPAAKAALDQGETARKRLLAVQGTPNQFRSHPEAAGLLAARANWSFLQASKDNPQNTALLNAALTDWTAAEKEMTAAIGDADALSHPLNGRYVYWQAVVFYRLQKYAESEARLRFWESDFLESMPPNHPWSAETLEGLVMILKAQNKDFQEAEAQAKEIRDALAKGA